MAPEIRRDDAGHIAMLRDAVLPAGIRPSPQPVTPLESVLVTGATGFLGRHLVGELLEKTGLRVVCLVRAADDGAARERLLASLTTAQLALGRLSRRISVVAGDVTENRLGLTERRYEELAAGIGEVFHCAAEVNWQRSYAKLRKANVTGCVEIIRFACAGRPKRVQFISTMAVCFAENGGGRIAESSETLPLVGSLPLGYAQSKCVSEHLFRQAARRGVPVSIIRPGLISGHSATGRSDHGDVLCAMFEGCINARAAPDFDWLVDCVPVDVVAAALARRAGTKRPDWEVLHVIHERPRHWREVVLWMNLYGYDVRLLPMEEWNGLVFRQDAPSARLRRFRRFFAGWRQVPERPAPYQAYLAHEQRRVDSSRSHSVLNRLGLRPPPLDAALLARYLEHFTSTGLVPRVRPPPGNGAAAAQAASLLASTMRPWLAARGLEIAAVSERPLHDSNGILNELSAVQDGRSVGIKLFDVGVRGSNGMTRRPLSVLLKSKARDALLENLMTEVATRCDPELGRYFTIFRDELGLRGCHEREIALYQLAEPRLRAHSPTCYGVVADPRRDLWVLVLEFVNAADESGPEERLTGWDAKRIEAVIPGLAEIHSVWYGRENELLRQPWLTNAVDAARQAEMTPMWLALGRFASRFFGDWLGRPTAAMQESLIRTVGERSGALEAMPRTLIHNDFNPRNLKLRQGVVRPRLCVFDWELATIGVPQHDLAEFLCFTLPDSARAADVLGWLEMHRAALLASAGTAIPESDWIRGFQLSLQQLLVNRLAMYTLIHRFRPLPYLPRVIRNWEALDRVVASTQATKPAHHRRSGPAAKSPIAIPITAKPTEIPSRYAGARRRIPQR